jgi:phosphatidylinositol glycan class V
MTNHYDWEINYAFLPGIVTFIRTFEIVAKYLAGGYADTLWVVMVVVVNKGLTALAAVYLYRIAYRLTKTERVARASAIVFLFNPASIFYHAVYSEPLYSCLTFIAIDNLLKDKNWTDSIEHPVDFIRNNFVKLILLGISVSIRTTAMFLSLTFGYPILQHLFQHLKTLSILPTLKTCLTGALTLLFFLSFFLLYLSYGYSQFCESPPFSRFCSNLLPNIYSYAQERYWYVGFLNYYRVKHTVFILFGMPSILVALVTVGNRYLQLSGLTISYYLLLFVTVGYSNVQSSARFFSSHPLYSINMAVFLTVGRGDGTEAKEAKTTFMQRFILLYLVLYNFAGIVMFPIRFPWT